MIMNKSGRIFKNTFIGLLSQCVSTTLSFVIRRFFIINIGIELIGLNSTFASVLQTLSLADLGFQSAISYSLYEPIASKNYKRVNDIMTVFCVVYKVIGVVFVVLSFLCLPFLKYILSGIDITLDVYVYFILQASSSSCSYFLAYKRALLYADQHEYISKIIDTIATLMAGILKLYCICCLSSYYGYLITSIIQVVASNICVHYVCKKRYLFLHSVKFNIIEFKRIWEKVKNVIFGKIASYIYLSTDSIIISAFVSTLSVGYLVNYTTLSNALKTITNAMLNPIIPTIGNYLVVEKNNTKKKELIIFYTHIRFYLAIICIIPFIVIADDLITIWVGAEQVLPHIVVWLLSIEFYIHIVHTALSDYINGGGYFKEERNIDAIAAVTNLLTSIVFVKICGLTGVLVGTIISQLIFWTGRLYVVYLKMLKQNSLEVLKYVVRNVAYFLLFIILAVLGVFLYSHLYIEDIFIKIICGTIIVESISLFVIVLVFFKLPEQKKMFYFFLRMKKQR